MQNHADWVDNFTGTSRFKIVRRIGAGGMGVVYEALDRECNARVALKTLRAFSPTALLYLKREFRALQDVNHPNLVNLGELIQDGDRWFFTMELIDGVDFIEWVRGTSTISAGLNLAEASRGAPVVTMPRDERWKVGTLDTMVGGPDATGLQPIPHGGPSAPSYEPPAAAETFDEQRLRAAAGQLASGLVALHAAHKVHCDVKPSNVLVTRTGRVVLLDFGLVTDIVQEGASGTNEIVGTAAYMAPEQAVSRQVGTEADWYGLGVLIYEALTGRLPFSGASALAILMSKQNRDAQPPIELVPDLPEDLNELCVALLHRDPKSRPGAARVLKCMRFEAPADVALPMSIGPGALVGRTREMAALQAAATEVEAGRPVAVTVRGESGVGKSYLARHFLERQVELDPRTAVLTGRCYERESVPYKAFDGIVDELTRFLARRPYAEVAALLPARAAALAQVFPVLRRVDAIARAPLAGEWLDPQVLRTRVFAALRELFTRISNHYRLVLVVDDLQWTDADSLNLLREILRPPDAPPLLFLATLRETATATVPLAEVEDALTFAGAVHDVRLQTLSHADARELATHLAKSMGQLTELEAHAIATDTGGHPLFIHELVQHLVLGGDQRGLVQIEDAIMARVERLEPASRSIVHLVALAGKPLFQDVIARASGIEFEEFAQRGAQLRVANLARISGARRHDYIEPYHDRVREAVLGTLEPDQRSDLHRRLALALEGAEQSDPETLAVHWSGAGQPDRAIRHVLLAAAQAETAVAFRRAARLYRLALQLGVSAAQRREVLSKLAEALANGGEGAEAALTYRDAAADAPAAFKVEYERRAAEQLLRVGHIDQGIDQMRSVLARVGMHLPGTPVRALFSVLLQRALLALRGLGFTERDPTEVSPAELARIDMCWSLASLGLIDTIRGADFGVRQLRLALRVGERNRLARALGVEAVYVAQMTRTETKASRLIELAEQLSRKDNQATFVGIVAATRGLVEFVFGHFRVARAHLERSERIFADSCVGVAWEIDVTRLFALICLSYEGQLQELRRRLKPIVLEAEDRGDLFAATSIRVAVGSLVALADDQPAEARRDVHEAMKRWSQQGFQMQHRYALLTDVEVDLYEGEASAAYQRLAANWQAVERSMLLQIKQQRLETFSAFARAAVAAAAVQRGAERDRLLRVAERFAAKIEREGMVWAQSMARLVRAAVARLRGDPASAVTLLGMATNGFETAEMRLYASAARRQQGRLIGGDEGRDLIAESEAFLASMQVRNVDRLTAMLAPGFAE